MRLSYKLKNGCHIKIFDYDILEEQAENHEKSWKKMVSGYLTDTNDEDMEIDFSSPVLKEADRFYFMSFGHKIYFDEYEYLSLEELIKKLETEEYVSSDVILPSLIKNADNVAFIESRRVPDMVWNDLGIRSYSGKDEYMGIVCQPTEEYYKRYNWAYKIQTIPVDEEEKQIFGKESYYSDDYCRWINLGYVKIISRDDIKKYAVSEKKIVTRKLFKKG